MWIFDSAYRDGGVDLWSKDGTVTKVHHAYEPPFLVHFRDPHTHAGMIDALGERYRAEECTIHTIFGDLPGLSVYAGRDVAEAIELQAGFSVDLFNVDVRRDQRFMAGHGLFPCGNGDDSRFSPEVRHDLDIATIRVRGNPAHAAFTEIELVHERAERLAGQEREVLADLFSLVAAADPDVLLMPDADRWMPKLQAQARRLGLGMPFSRNGRYRKMESRSVLELREDGAQGSRPSSRTGAS